MNKKLTAFCFTDIHNQASMLDYPTSLRSSLITACENAVKDYGKADLAIVGGDNVSDYPFWDKSCWLPKKNFLDIKRKLNDCVSATAVGGKVLYAAGNNDMILGDIGTAENDPYNTTDFYDCMDKSLGVLPENERLKAYSLQKPTEKYLDAFHYTVNGFDFIVINIDPNTAYNTHEGYYTDESMLWVKNKLNEIDPLGDKPVFVIGHLSAAYYYNHTDFKETLINGNVQLFYDIFKGHKNAFYLFGHVHGENACYTDYSSGAVLHIKDGKPLNANLAEENSKGKDYDYTFVHMGGLRPFNAKYFKHDGITGYGGNEEKQYFIATGTPLLAQYLVIEIYDDKAVFTIRNAGELENYSRADELKPYEVYFK